MISTNVNSTSVKLEMHGNSRVQDIRTHFISTLDAAAGLSDLELCDRRKETLTWRKKRTKSDSTADDGNRAAHIKGAHQ